jgi:hypothetical protein
MWSARTYRSAGSPRTQAPQQFQNSRSPRGWWLFNNFVGKSNQLIRQGKSEGLGSFEVDDQFEFGRLCYAKKPA